MSVDYTRTTGAETPEESESNMFAPAPIWDRRKGKGAGRAFFENAAVAQAAEPVTVTKRTRLDTTASTAGVAGGAVLGEEVTRETAMSPNGDDAAYVTTTDRTVVRRDRSMAPVAVGVGLVALAALAGAGYYATRPAEQTLTPGGPTSTSIATAPAATDGANTTTQMAANTPTADNAAAASPQATTTTTTHRSVTTSTRAATPVVRSRSTTMAISPERSVTARSAATSGVNTGANVGSVGSVPSTPSTATPPPASAAPPASPMPAPATPSTVAPTPAPTTTPDVSPAAPTSAPAPTPPQ